MNTKEYTIKRNYILLINFDKIAEMHIERYDGAVPTCEDMSPIVNDYIEKYHSESILEDLDDGVNNYIYDDIIDDAVYYTRKAITDKEKESQTESNSNVKEMKELDKFLRDMCATNEKCQNCRLIHADNTCVFACECMKHNFHNYTPSIF